MIRRARFSPPPANSLPANSEVQRQILHPILGIDGRVPATRLPLGATPESRNVVRGHATNQLTTRSGLSNYGNAGLLSALPIMASQAVAVNGIQYNIISSMSSIAYIDNAVSIWSHLVGPTTSSNTSIYSTTAVFNRTTGEKDFIFTNGTDIPKRWIVSQRTVSLLSSFASTESYAAFVTGFDDRAVFFNTGVSATSRYPTRVRWSMRGDPSNYTDVDAGFADIGAMRGYGTGIVSEQDRMLLFSDREVWQARRRGDAFVFDFIPITTKLGCPFPQTIRNTARQGTMFMGPDYQIYRVHEQSVEAIGQPIQPYIIRTLFSDQLLWSAYDELTNKYQLYYSSTAADTPNLAYPSSNASLLAMNDAEAGHRFTLTGGLLTLVDDINAAGNYSSGVEDGYLVLYAAVDYPSRAVWLDTDDIADEASAAPIVGIAPWFMQDFRSYRFVTGFDNMLVSSKGTPYRWIASQYDDDGVDLDARWCSGGIHGSADPMQFEKMTEFFVEYEQLSSSSLTIYFSKDNGATFNLERAASLISGVNTLTLAITSPAARHHMFEVRLEDSRTKISSFQLGLKAYSGKRNAL